MHNLSENDDKKNDSADESEESLDLLLVFSLFKRNKHSYRMKEKVTWHDLFKSEEPMVIDFTDD